jgi:spermidine/putrescine transport system permease protein
MVETVRKPWSLVIRQRWVTLACTCVWIGQFAMLFLTPFAVIVGYSFRARDYHGGVAPGWSFDGWRALLSPSIVEIGARSLLLALATTMLCVVLGTPVAVTIWQATGRLRARFLFLLVLPLAVNAVLVAYSWQVLLGNRGIVNRVLLFVGLSDSPVGLLYNPITVGVGLFSAYLAYFVLTVFLSLERIQPGLVVASSSLGASPLQTLRGVVLPLAKPGLIAGSLIVFLPCVAEYVVPDLLGGSKTFLFGNYTKFAFYEGRNWPLASALLTAASGLLALLAIPAASQLRGVFFEEPLE